MYRMEVDTELVEYCFRVIYLEHLSPMELNGILLFDEMTTAVVRATTVLSPTTAEEAEEADAALDAGVDGRALVSGDRYGELQLGIEELAVLPTVESAIEAAHVVNGRHCSARETGANIRGMYPGQRVHNRVVIEFVYACAICQKNRDSMPKWDTLKPITKRLRPKHPRGRVGIDTFFVSPADDEGHTCIHVVVCHTTHLVYFYASKDHTQESMADALFNFYCTYGSFEELASDPGADLMSNLVEVLLKRFGAHHRVSLVAVHTSSGVEGTNAILAIHLRAICVDEVLRNRGAVHVFSS
jgi:hypothetical protein